MKAPRLLSAAALATAGIVAGFFLAARAGVFGWGEPEGLATVTREDFRTVIEAAGVLEATVSNQLGPPSIADLWEYNLTFMAPEGPLVRQGDVVLRFDGTRMAEKLKEAEAELETAAKEREKEEKNLEIELRQLELSLVESRAEQDRAALEAAAPEGLLSSIDAQELKLREALAVDTVRFLERKIAARRAQVEAQLRLLEVKIRRAEQRTRSYRTALDKFDVRAPSDGAVVYIRKRNGDRWDVGESVWMMAKVVEVADVSTLGVSAQVLEVDSGRIRTGQGASVTVDAIPGRVWRSQVANVGKLVRARSQQDPSKVFDVRIPLQEIDRRTMRPGMGVRVEIEEEVLPGALTLPVAAVTDRQGRPCVLVQGPRGPEERTVTLGPRNRERIVVREGLAEGERVLLDPSRPMEAS